jgi:hypothetical protein
VVTSSWSNVAGRKGRAVLEQQERDWRRFERAMNRVLAAR